MAIRIPAQLNGRYGQAINLADFVRKAQLMNYEAFRAMYEGRFAKMFNARHGRDHLDEQSGPAEFCVADL